MTAELAAIVARDAEYGESVDMTVNHSLAARLILDGAEDRRALLALLRETREALAEIAKRAYEQHDGAYYWIEGEANHRLARLRALDPEPAR
jgi:hypothetical protein